MLEPAAPNKPLGLKQLCSQTPAHSSRCGSNTTVELLGAESHHCKLRTSQVSDPTQDTWSANEGPGITWMSTGTGGVLHKGIWHKFTLSSLKAGLAVTAPTAKPPPSLQQE